MDTLNKTQAWCKLCLIALVMYYLSHHNVAFYEQIQEIKYCFSDGAHVSHMRLIEETSVYILFSLSIGFVFVFSQSLWGLGTKTTSVRRDH